MSATLLTREKSVSEIDYQQAKTELEARKFSLFISHRKQIFTSLIFVVVWLIMGAVVYGWQHGWAFTAAVYYSAQAGLSIGFGAMSEDNDFSRAYTVLHIMMGSSIIAGAVGLFVSNVLEKTVQDWDIATEKARTGQEEEEEESSFSTWLSSHATFVRCAIVGSVWGSVGIGYGLVVEKWTFIQSVYFTVTACSTAGLQAPTMNTEQNTFTAVYLAIFVLIGVPVYGMILGQFANLTINDYLEQKTQMKIHKRLTKAQLKFAMCYNGIDDGLVQFEDFLCFSLIRLGICDIDLLDKIKEQFVSLDVDNSGYLERSELAAAMLFAKYDSTRSGVIDKVAFAALWAALNADNADNFDEENAGIFSEIAIFKHEFAADRIYDDIDEDGNGNITRREFIRFWNWVRSPAAIEFFATNGDAWLANTLTGSNTMSAQYDRIDLDISDGKSDSALAKSIKNKSSTLAYFHKWTLTESGQKWLSEQGSELKMATTERLFDFGKAVVIPREAFVNHQNSGSRLPKLSALLTTAAAHDMGSDMENMDLA